jgi:hypothetical protein
MICNICRQSFKKKRSNQLYCSSTCKERNKKKPWLRHRKNSCEICGFIPKFMCQLDVDHIDGNRENNDVINLQTLCANCHRLKTYEAKDWKSRYE